MFKLALTVCTLRLTSRTTFSFVSGETPRFSHAVALLDEQFDERGGRLALAAGARAQLACESLLELNLNMWKRTATPGELKRAVANLVLNGKRSASTTR
eukprot:6178325-Pleurochrysis_carterae.AAC.1